VFNDYDSLRDYSEMYLRPFSGENYISLRQVSFTKLNASIVAWLRDGGVAVTELWVRESSWSLGRDLRSCLKVMEIPRGHFCFLEIPDFEKD
jgi:hypothetical protein